MEDPRKFCPELIQELKQVLENKKEYAAEKIQGYIERQKNIPIKIGITGQSGSGKSTFVNAFRGMSDDDEGAALTGVVETTMEVKEYPHPNYPNVIFCDLPGVGTPKFPADQYLQTVGFENFDFFIIISANRFSEHDVKLAKNIQKMGKKFYFVRSKIDNNLYSEKRKKGFNKQKTLEKIKEDCIQGLREQGVESPQVFLVSNFDIQLYDFSLLQETLKKDLPAHKRDVLLLAIPSINPEVINDKKKALMKQRWYYTAISGFVAAVPIPGLSVDLRLLVTAVTTFVVGFGLDPGSLKRLADCSGIPYEELRGVIKSPLAATEITKDLLQKVVLHFASTVASMAAEEVSIFSPLFGIPMSMYFYAVTTHRFMTLFINMLAEDALRVSDKVLNGDPSQ